MKDRSTRSTTTGDPDVPASRVDNASAVARSSSPPIAITCTPRVLRTVIVRASDIGFTWKIEG